MKSRGGRIKFVCVCVWIFVGRPGGKGLMLFSNDAQKLNSDRICQQIDLTNYILR